VKYVIKLGSSYAQLDPRFAAHPAYGFDYEDTLDDATKFDSVMASIDAIQPYREVAL